MNQSVERADRDPLLDHEYDGIRELDNPLPGWWRWIFVGSIAFSFAYVTWYHLGVGASVHEKYDAEVTAFVEKLLAQLGEVKPDNATILSLKDNDEWMSAVRGMFVGNCAQCHATDGGGNIGPNLTDDRYKNLTSPSEIFTVITDGVPNTAMAPWGDRLSEPQRILLSAYVASLRGTTPATGKAAEGDVLPAWTTFASPADADAVQPAPGESGG